MKQHINKKQWNKLNKEKQNFLLGNFQDVWNFKKGYLEINIGQMIEFLGDDNYPKAICERWGDSLDLPKDYIGISCEDLCDALWEAVKHKLNN